MATPTADAGNHREVDAAAQPAIGGGALPLGVLGTLPPHLEALRLVGQAMATAARRPKVLGLGAGFAAECARIAVGTSIVAPDPKDHRFSDPTWQDNPAFHRMLQTYLAWADVMRRATDAPTGEWRDREHARFGTEILVSAPAPTNYLATNPAALKRAFETGGKSVLRAGRNLLRDVLTNGGVPLQVERNRFQVGRDLAATPGEVVLHTELFELIQYRPTTPKVHEVPVLVVPPVINRHYFVDMAPGKSFVEFLVGAGFTVFLPVWRNPHPGDGATDLEDYATEILHMLDVVAAIASAEKIHVFGSCTGGNVVLPAAAVDAARGEDRIASIGLGVAMVTYDQASGVGMVASEQAVARLRKDAQRGKIVPARNIEQGFGWLKPDQLVWSFVVNNWVMGNEPPGGEVLAWSSAPTAAPAGLAADLVEMSLRDSLRHPGTLRVLGTSVDLGAIKQDNYVVAGRGDHISPWQACYSATELLGGESRFVLTPAGHLPTQVSPPSSKKARYFTGPEGGAVAAEEWVAAAELQDGSWWNDYADWLRERSGEQRPAPKTLGSAAHPPLGPAPGRYAVE